MNYKKLIYYFYKFIGKFIPSRKIRGRMVKAMGVKCGKNINISYGAGVYMDLEIGDYSGIGKNCKIGPRVCIGDYVMMGPECLLYTSTHNIDNLEVPMCRQGETSSGKIVVGNDVWIGARVIIPHGGIKIGNGAVIGAGSVLTKSVPDYAIVAGNPAKIIKWRNVNEQ